MQTCKAHAARTAVGRGTVRSRRLRVVALQAGASDHTARVRGDVQRVSWYCSDLAAWPSWSPVTKHAIKLGLSNDAVERGSKFELKQELWGVLSYPMIYEVLEFEPGKKLVLSGLSEHHTQLDQFVFMPDRHDMNMTIVRYVSNAQLRQWRSALQPLLEHMLKRVPEDSLLALGKLLNGPRTPIYSPEFQEAWSRHARAAVDARKGRSSGGGGGRAPAAQGRSRGAGGGSFASWSFDSLWGGGGKSGGGSAAEGRRVPPAAPDHHDHLPLPVAAQDPAGHYAALGLGALGALGAAPTPEEVRAAYRRMALRLHPDRQLGGSAQAQRQAASEFSRVLRAYETLKDPETRRLYDSGLLVEQTLDF